MALIRSFQAMESSTAHSVGVSIHRLTWASRRSFSSAISTMILIETFVTVTVGTETGSTLRIEGTAIEGTLTIEGAQAIEGTLLVVGSDMKLTTTITSIMASTTGLAIPTTAAFSPVSTAAVRWRRAHTADSMKAKDSMEDILAKDSMEEAALSARTEWQAFRVEVGVTREEAFQVEAQVMLAAAMPVVQAVTLEVEEAVVMLVAEAVTTEH